jgi:hypothetical protein
MTTLRKRIHLPSVTLKLLVGEGSIIPAAFRRSRIERVWPCGCLADYEFDKPDDVQWTPCESHEPLRPMVEGIVE